MVEPVLCSVLGISSEVRLCTMNNLCKCFRELSEAKFDRQIRVLQLPRVWSVCLKKKFRLEQFTEMILKTDIVNVIYLHFMRRENFINPTSPLIYEISFSFLIVNRIEFLFRAFIGQNTNCVLGILKHYSRGIFLFLFMHFLFFTTTK